MLNLWRRLATQDVKGTSSLLQIPTIQARYVATANITQTKATVAWSRGNGAGRVVVISEDAITEMPNHFANYNNTDGTIGKAMKIGSSNDYVIGYTTGSTGKLVISGLTANTTYYIRVFEYNGKHGEYYFNLNTASKNPISFTTTA